MSVDISSLFKPCFNISVNLLTAFLCRPFPVYDHLIRMLAEAGYIDNTRTCRLLPVVLVPDIRQYLKEHGETYVLRCMEVTSL